MSFVLTSALVSLNYHTSAPVSTGMGNYLRVRVAFAPYWYLIKHPGQLSLAVPPWVSEMSIGNGYDRCWGRNDEF